MTAAATPQRAIMVEAIKTLIHLRQRSAILWREGHACYLPASFFVPAPAILRHLAARGFIEEVPGNKACRDEQDKVYILTAKGRKVVEP